MLYRAFLPNRGRTRSASRPCRNAFEKFNISTAFWIPPEKYDSHQYLPWISNSYICIMGEMET